MKKNNKSKEVSLFNKVFNNPRTLIIFLICLLIFLTVFLYIITTSRKFYAGQVSESDLSVAELLYYQDNQMTYFYANNAVYGGTDMDIYEFDIKYVIDVDGKENIIEEFKTSFDEKQSLKQTILNYSKFKVVDLRNKSKEIFTKEMKDNINHLKLVIKAATEKSGLYDFDKTYNIQLSKVN